MGVRWLVEMLLDEDHAVRWTRPVLGSWGWLFVGFVFLFVWRPIGATTVGSRVLLWMVIYVVYLFCLEILSRRAQRLYETPLFRLFRIHYNLAMIAFLMLLEPPSTSGYLWFFFSMPMLAVLLYFGRPLPLLIIYLEVCATMLVVILAQGRTTLDFAAMVAQDAILGLLAAVLYFFVHFFPRIRAENTLLKVATTLMQVLDREELAQLLADAAKAGIPASDSAVVHLLAGEGNRVLVPMGSSRVDLTTLGQTPMEVGVGIAGHAIQDRKTINVLDVSEDDRYLQIPASFISFKSLLVAPMYVGDRNVGAISVHSAKRGAFGERDERFLTMLAAQGTMAISNAELYDTRTRRRQQLSDILEASRTFGLNQPLDTLLETIAAEVCRCSGYRMAVVNLLDEASGEIVARAMAGVPPAGRRKLEDMHIPHDIVAPLLQDQFRISQSYFIRHDRRPEIPDLDQYTFTTDLGECKPGEWHQEDMLIVPIQTQEEKLLGYISVDDPNDRQLPSLDTVQALEILASVAATAIQNARLYETLAEERNLLRTVIDNLPDLIYAKDTESRFVIGNVAVAQVMGATPDDLLGKTDHDFYPKELADQYREDEQNVIRSRQPLLNREEPLMELKTERRGWLSTAKVPWLDSPGTIVGVVGIGRDITERKQTEETLQRRNRELEMLNRVGHALVSILNLDQVLVTVLEEVRRLLDVTAASVWLIELETGELICQQATGPKSEIVRGWRLAPGEGLAGWVARHGESLIVSDAWGDECCSKGVEQQTGLMPRSILTVPLWVKNSAIGTLQVMDTEANRFSTTDLTLLEPLAASAAIAIDNARMIEAQRQYAVELQARNEETDRLRAFNENIVQSMDEGIILEDEMGHITFVNLKTVELLGYASEELIGQHWMVTAAPEEVAKIKEEAAKWPQGVTSRYETVLLTKEGQRVPVIVSATPLFDEDSFAGVLVVFTDITDRKQQETRLQEYLSTVTNSLAHHTSLEGLYKFIVEAGTRFLSARDCALFLTSDESGNALELGAATASPLRTDRPRIAANTGSGYGLVTHVVEWRQPVRLLGREMLQHPLWNRELWTRLGWNFDPESDHSLLAAPMCLPDGCPVGVLVARDAESDEGFSEFDEVLLQTLATNATANIERVRGLEKAREEAVRAERKRLETDLHEAMNVLATGVRWEAEILSDEIERNDLAAAGIALERLQAALPRAYTDLRYLLEDLRDPTLEQEGLLIALRKRAELIGRGYIMVHGDPWERLPPEVEGILYRIGQELMSNAVKHSGVVRDTDVKIEVWLERSDGQVRLCVKDDGVGFDVEATLALTHKWGLRRLRDTLREMGCNLGIDSAPGEGAMIYATIDLTRGSYAQ